MMYLYLFLVALILTGATWGLVRLFGGKASFEGIFKLIATAFITLPVIAVSFMGSSANRVGNFCDSGSDSGM